MAIIFISIIESKEAEMLLSVDLFNFQSNFTGWCDE